MSDVLIYTKWHCPFCRAAKDLLARKGVAFREIEITNNDGLRQEMIRLSGRMTVPQVFIGSEHIGGHDDLVALDRAKHLDPKLLALTIK